MYKSLNLTSYSLKKLCETLKQPAYNTAASVAEQTDCELTMLLLWLMASFLGIINVSNEHRGHGYIDD